MNHAARSGLLMALALGLAVGCMNVLDDPTSHPHLRLVASINLPVDLPSVLDQMTVDAAHRRLYIADAGQPGAAIAKAGTGKLIVVDLDSFRVLQVVDLHREARWVGVDPLGEVAYVSDKDHWIDRIDLLTGTRTTEVSTDPLEPWSVFVSPDGRRVIATYTDGTSHIAYLDPQSLSVLGATQMPGAGGPATVDWSQGLWYQVLEHKLQVAVVDVRTGLLDYQLPMCGVETPRGIALDATRQLLFVIAGNNGRLDRISLDDGSCSSFPDDVGYGADSVVVDSARDRVYVINLLESTVDTIDTEGNHRGTYNITGAGQGIAVDARTGYVFAEEETLGKLLVLAPD